MGRVVVIGSINVDQVAVVAQRPRPGETVLALGHQQLAGGKGANQAIAAARAGAEVMMVGCVGNDAGGAAYRERLAAHGIDVSTVRVSPTLPTGTASFTPPAQATQWRCAAAGASATGFAGFAAGSLPARFAPSECK